MLKRRIYDILALIALLFLAACQDDAVMSNKENVREGAILFGGLTKQESGLAWVNGRTDTRAGSSESVKSETPENIGVFAFGDGPNTTYVFRNQKVYWQNGKSFKKPGSSDDRFTWDYTEHSVWPYTTDADESSSTQTPWEKQKYKFFAYSPWYPTENVSVAAENFEGFRTFVWDNIPGFSDEDFVLANKIIEVNNTGKDNNGNEIPTKVTADLVTFSLRHILSRIRFFYKTTEEYRGLRKIEINSMTVMNVGKIKSATFNFENNTWDEKVVWGNEQTGTPDPVVLVNKTLVDGKYVENPDYEVKTTYPDHDKPYASVYVYPQTISELTLKVNYTVKDRSDVVTRTAEVINTVSLSSAWNLLAGHYYDIKILIVPDYLYVLSDNDQDFDGYVIVKDS